MSRLTMGQKMKAVGGAALFSSMGARELGELIKACPARGLAAGEQVFGPGEKADRFFVILAGKVKVYMISAKGDEQILHLYGQGQTFGEAAMWGGGRFPAYAEAVEETELLVVSRAVLKELISRNAELALSMMAGLSRKLREFSVLIEQLSLKDVPARLAKALLEMPASGGGRIELRQTKKQLAGQIGTIPETLSRAFKKLETAGLIEVEGGRIQVLDAEGLERVAGS